MCKTSIEDSACGAGWCWVSCEPRSPHRLLTFERKSQLAIEYSYRVREESPDTWVFWVHASNASRLELSYREIADRLELPGRHDATANVLQLVNNWLYNSKHGKWILILDNLDDEGLLEEPLQNGQTNDAGSQTSTLKRPLLGLLPRCPHGAIIFTTRNKAVALKLVSDRDILHINPMDAPSALALLRKKLSINTADEEEAGKLLEALEFMPLAIIQASAFMQYHAPRYSIARYLKDFENNSHILDHEAAQPQRDYEASNSILRTWQISFDYIRQSRPTAADLLSLMSFFDRQGIPEILLRSTPRAQEGDGNVTQCENEYGVPRKTADSAFEFEHDIRMLREFSFIAIRRDPQIFEMHRLVQLAIKGWLEREGLVSRWQGRSMNSLDRIFPFQAKDQPKYEFLYPHLNKAVAERPSLPTLMPNWISLLMKGVTHAAYCGDYRDMKQMASTLREASEQLFGSGNLMATFVNEMEALVLQYQHNQEKLVARHLQTIRSCQELGGETHYLTLEAMDSLTDVYLMQGRLQQAEELGAKVLQSSRQVYGYTHHVTVSASKTLRRVYIRQRRWRQAEELALQDIQVAKELLGDEHSRTFEAVEELGQLHMMQGKWYDAQSLLMSLVEAKKRLLGSRDPSTLGSMGLLAEVYEGQGRLVEAKRLYTHVLQVQKEEHREDESLTTRFRAILQRKHDDSNETTSLYQRIVKIFQGPLREQVMELMVAPWAPKTTSLTDHLGALYYSQKKWEAAEKAFLEALTTRLETLGEAHLDTITTRGNLGAVYIEQMRWTDAEGVFVRNLDMLSNQSPRSEEGLSAEINARMKLGIIYAKQERWKDADIEFMQALERNSESQRPGDEYSPTLSTAIGLEARHSGEKRLMDAVRRFMDFINSRELTLREKHPRAAVVSRELLELMVMMLNDLQTAHDREVATLELMKQAASVTASVQQIQDLQSLHTEHSPVLEKVGSIIQTMETLMSELDANPQGDKSEEWSSYFGWLLLVSILVGGLAFFL